MGDVLIEALTKWPSLHLHGGATYEEHMLVSVLSVARPLMAQEITWPHHCALGMGVWVGLCAWRRWCEPGAGAFGDR